MTGYGQFCPVAKAMEVLDERWTILVVRELLSGSTRFNQLRRGVPRMSPALLSKRLRTLERAGVVSRTTTGRNTAYLLTPAGRDLAEVVHTLGLWALRWIPELGEEDYDPHLLMWDIRRTLPVDAWPRGRTTVALRFVDVAARDVAWWLVVNGSDVDLCEQDPGFETDATVTTGLRTLTRIWRGELSWHEAIASGSTLVEAPSTVAHQVPQWFGRSALATLAAAG